MELASNSSAFSGIVGGLLAIILCYTLSRWVPKVCNGKDAATLVLENRMAIWTANGFFFCGLLAGIAIYKFGYLPSNDWRGLALGAGGGSFAAIAAIFLLSAITNRSPREAYVAYAISQKTPVILIYGILVLCASAFSAAITSLLAV